MPLTELLTEEFQYACDYFSYMYVALL